jgi:hypothetical protein
MSTRPDPPGLPEWLGWSTQRVSRWVSSRPEPVVMGWPYNGTRRWYVAYRLRNPGADDYLGILIRRQAELHRLIFAHGVSVILAPSFGTETLRRGEAYTRYALGGLERLPEDEVYQALIDSGVRIRFYGDYEMALATAGLHTALEACLALNNANADEDGPLLLIGLFADDPYPTIARLSVEFAGREGRPPDRAELIEAYFGVSVPDLSLYVGFAQPEMFDVPLLNNGLEHLYVTLNPSPDLTERQLREILYDHLVARRAAPVDYEALSPRAQQDLAKYTERSKGDTLGIGRIDPLTGLWRPVLPTHDRYD